MDTQNQHLETLSHIKSMMERSSRFISLSGLSGIAAGCCALIGAWFANNVMSHRTSRQNNYTETDFAASAHNTKAFSMTDLLQDQLLQIAVLTFVAAFVFSFFFTYLRSKKTNTPIWGASSKRLTWNVMMPMTVGGLFLLKMVDLGYFGLIAPGCLLFYGLALVNASKYTLGEVKYLGYGQIILGLLNLWFIGHSLLFWALGFGILHIIYGVAMWWKYERN